MAVAFSILAYLIGGVLGILSLIILLAAIFGKEMASDPGTEFKARALLIGIGILLGAFGLAFGAYGTYLWN